MFFILLYHKIFLMMMFKRNTYRFLTIIFCFLFFFTGSIYFYGQNNTQTTANRKFWERVHFGGGLGLSIGNRFTNITIAPGAIYEVSEYVSTGLGIQYSYINQKDFYNSHLYGGSVILLVNPIQQVQLSAELEELRVNNTYTQFNPEIKDNFWNTALFLGGGYRMQNVTIGIRYNILYKESNNVYSQAWMPFIRVYF